MILLLIKIASVWFVLSVIVGLIVGPILRDEYNQQTRKPNELPKETGGF
jgi:hypothetical protein